MRNLAIQLLVVTLASCGDPEPRAEDRTLLDTARAPAPSLPRAEETATDSNRAGYEKDRFRPTVGAWSLDEVPDWYAGTLGPWKQLSEETRRNLWNARGSYEGVMNEALKPAEPQRAAPEAAARGERILHRVVADYGLDPYFREADTFGPRMVIWLPETAWARMSDPDKRALEAYMASKYRNWGIGVGKQKGREVLFDRLVVER